jgi:hypothetical protein
LICFSLSHSARLPYPSLRRRCATFRLLFRSRCICGGHTPLGSTLQKSTAGTAACRLFCSGLLPQYCRFFFLLSPLPTSSRYQRRCTNADTMSPHPFVLSLLLMPHALQRHSLSPQSKLFYQGLPRVNCGQVQSMSVSVLTRACPTCYDVHHRTLLHSLTNGTDAK